MHTGTPVDDPDYQVPFPFTGKLEKIAFDLDEVAGCLRSKRKSKTSAQMRNAVGREVIRRHDRGRY